MAIAQSVDYLKIQEQLSPDTRKIYNEIRSIFPIFVNDSPMYKDIRNITEYLSNKEIERTK